MRHSKNQKETYLKFVIVIAIALFAMGIILHLLFPSGFLSVVASSLIQLGITLAIVDLFISNFASDIFRKEIIKNFREVLGINNPKSKLFPELIRLMRPHPYHILDFRTENNLIYNNKNQEYNMAIVEKTTIQVQAREDNVHYHFFRGSEPGSNSPENLKEIRLNGVLLDNEKDLIINENKDKQHIEYMVKHRLKNGTTYKFEILYHYPVSMSDLNFGKVKEDSFIQHFIELTNKVTMVYRFPYDLKNYNFTIKRCDACKREKFLTPNIKKRVLTIEQENLDNGDFIDITYKKKFKQTTP